MKRLTVAILVLATLLSLSACGAKTEDVRANSKATNKAQITTIQEKTNTEETEVTTTATTTTKETTTEASNPVLTNLSSLSDEELAKLYGTLCDKEQYPESCVSLKIDTSGMSQKEIDEAYEKMNEHNDTHKITENIALFWTEKGVDINASSQEMDRKYEFKYDCITGAYLSALYPTECQCPNLGLCVGDEKKAKHICELLDATFFKPYNLSRLSNVPDYVTGIGYYTNRQQQNGLIYGTCQYIVKEDYDGTPYYIIQVVLQGNSYYEYRKTCAQ